MSLDAISALKTGVTEQVNKLLVGYESVTEHLLVGLLSRGHVLLEGPPGTAKTLLAKAFAASLSLDFGRIQFTPDLMPGDVVGTNLFNFNTSTFELVKGPIFTQILLADEINRTPPKTQAALLEAMNEQSVTIDGNTMNLDDGFMVVATQNPIEQQGTYPLPEAQLDRFLFKVIMSYPDQEIEREIVTTHGQSVDPPTVESTAIEAVADLNMIIAARAQVSQIHASEAIVNYIVELSRLTRTDPALAYGVSPRAATMLARSVRAFAAVDGRDYVIPDDVKSLINQVYGHRVVLAPDAQIDGLTADAVLDRIVASVAPPK